jgi:hypothetical protein
MISRNLRTNPTGKAKGSSAALRRGGALAALAIALAVALAGCGPGQTSRSPAVVVHEYLSAERAADGKRICALYSDRYRDASEKDPDNSRHLSCARLATLYARRYGRERHELKKVQVDGFRAVATVTCADPTASDCSLPLVNRDGVWRIDGSLSPND